MKRLGILLVCFATMALTSCSLFETTTTNSAAQMAGQTCGAAVKGLYSSYKATGNVDLSNATNLTNALTLATNYSTLKQHKNDSDYKRAFARGMVASAGGLFTQASAMSFIDSLLASSGLSNVNSTNIAQTASTASAIITLLNAIK